MKYLFFVVTFASIYDRVLPLMEEKSESGEVIVVASTKQIELFFKEYTNFKVIRTKVHPDLITNKTKSRILLNILKSKLEYNRLFRDIRETEIYFCNKSWAIVIFSYIKKLSKRNKVFFFPKEKSPFEYPIDKSIKAYIMRWVAKWTLGIETIVCDNMGIPFWHLDERFFENMNYFEYDGGDKKILDIYAKKFDFLKDKQILIPIEDSIAAGMIEKSEFIDKMDHTIEILDSIYPGAYAIKPHPRLDRLFGKMSQCKDIIPPYIPAEFVLNHRWRVVIGINSGSLIQASKITNANVISLIDSIEFKDKNIKKMFRDWLEKESEKRIKFLGQVDELEELLRKTKSFKK